MDKIFVLAEKMRQIVLSRQPSIILKNKKMIALFHEPSTRTRLSFEMAMSYLGGHFFSTPNASESSSASKGETVEDTIKVLQGYALDVIVLRHHEDGFAARAAQASLVPIINAGDGKNQHPTQALIDLYTMQEKFGKIDGLRVAMVGDLAHYRSIRSLCFALAKFKKITIYLVSPVSFRIKDDVKNYLTKHEVWFLESDNLQKVAPLVDVIYQTRIQKERGIHFDNTDFMINKKILSLMKKEAIVMHPLPRVDEISLDVDEDPRAYYFKQAENGLYVRMALLKTMLVRE